MKCHATPQPQALVLKAEQGSQSHRKGWKRMLSSLETPCIFKVPQISFPLSCDLSG